jgi:hypothetical protein
MDLKRASQFRRGIGFSSPAAGVRKLNAMKAAFELSEPDAARPSDSAGLRFEPGTAHHHKPQRAEGFPLFVDLMHLIVDSFHVAGM